ncbi:MAG: hypothetical protein WBW74_24440 [Xanthobacteraceae bacterium]
MHVVIFTAIGLMVLAGFVLAARLFSRQGHRVDGTSPFIWVWLIAAVANGAVGVLQAGIPLINEIGAFIPIFGVPAAMAWYLSRRPQSR